MSAIHNQQVKNFSKNGPLKNRRALTAEEKEFLAPAHKLLAKVQNFNLRRGLKGEELLDVTARYTNEDNV